MLFFFEFDNIFLSVSVALLCLKRGTMNDEKKGCVFTWLIENYSYCWHKVGEKLVSPEFTADDLEGTVWNIQLYPRGKIDRYKGHVSLYLNRNLVDDGPENIKLRYSLSVLATDGSVLHSIEDEDNFKKGAGRGNGLFEGIKEVLVHRNADYLPQDILKVRCQIMREEGDNQVVTQVSARTRVGRDQISFLHVLEGFSTIEPNQKKTIQIGYHTKKEVALSSSLYLTDGSCCKQKIMVEIAPSNTKHVLSKCKLSLLNSTGKIIECAVADNRFDCARKEIRKLPLCLNKAAIVNRKNEYLSDDKLSLVCECVFSSGLKYNSIEAVLNEIPSVVLNQISDIGQHRDVRDAVNKLSSCPSALDDLRTIYTDKLLTDVELKTKTKSFPVHKVLLCARSPVLQAMLTIDMKEKNCNFIQVDDLEDDVVKQLLHFLYSDNIENLQWESAVNLYYAGDKYEIGKLKMLCSSFLADNLSISTASELLLLADTHSDPYLQKIVEDFIFEHEEEVFSSEEWRNLMETNSLLVSKTMLLKYMRKL